MDRTCSSRSAACSTRRCFPQASQLALITFPIMLGRGKRWYSGDPATARSWTLVEQAHSPRGVHFASFARDGEVRTGSFATKLPSEDELALRQRQAGGSLVSLQLFGPPLR